MKRLLLLCAGLPFFSVAQEVKPVLSPAYRALIHADSTSNKHGLLTDSTHDMRNASLRFDRAYYSPHLAIKKIHVTKNNVLELQPVVQRSVVFGGNASLTFGIQQPGRQPATQNEFVQGRANGGALTWRGPETGDPFSYGPSISTLQYDGSAYAYDINGRLVPLTAGNDGPVHRAAPYDNSILRNGAFVSPAVTLYTRFKKNYTSVFNLTLRAAQGREQTIIRGNNNKTDNFSAQADATIQRIAFAGSYSFRQERSTFSNRNGFLNRVYQNSVLSPVSFDTHQGTILNGGQRSYSPAADNPLFLLNDKDHGYIQQQQLVNFSAERRFNSIKIKLTQSLDLRRQLSREGLQPGTAFFPAGFSLQRRTRDHNYWLNSSLTWNIPFTDNYRFKAQALVNYIYSNNHSSIDYSIAHTAYRYQRSAHELSVSVSPSFSKDKIETGAILSGKLYSSNTSNRTSFLPGLSGYIRMYPAFGIRRLTGKLFGSFNRFNSELPLTSSFAGYNLLPLSTANALQYLPVNEITSFKNVSPIRHQEFNTGIEFLVGNRITVSANWFSRTTQDDLFPVAGAGGQLTLANIAAYRHHGIELQLSNDPWIFKKNIFGLGHTINFSRTRNKVTAVKDGYNYTAIAGFSDVHKTLVQGQPLGVITGSRWLRNEEGRLIIGNDGYPLVSPTPAVIGDATPDFIIKLNQYFTFKRKWELRVDWQWNKGGDIWNGTQALLDYYGRSASSGEQRLISGYVFDGVNTSGNHNTTPVTFYDPGKPVEQNRWVRYGPGGVAEAYIQKADCIRIQTISVSFKPAMRKKIKELAFTLYAGNIMIWSAYKGADPAQLLYDQSGTSGLDFFNLPAIRSFGFSSSLQF